MKQIAIPQKISPPPRNRDDDGRLDVGDLVPHVRAVGGGDLRRAAASRSAIAITWTASSTLPRRVATLNKRGQPIVTDNRIKAKIDFLVGLEKQQRIDPRALPRTPQHEEDADGATQALRYVADTEDYDSKRSCGLAQHAGRGCGRHPRLCRAVAQDLRLRRRRDGDQDRLRGLGPHVLGPAFVPSRISATPAISASWSGWTIDDALAQVPGRQGGARDHAWRRRRHTDTYDDKPKFTIWADKKRKRVRICQMWIKTRRRAGTSPSSPRAASSRPGRRLIGPTPARATASCSSSRRSSTARTSATATSAK